MKHTLSDFKEENKGWYFCNITAEIPFITQKHSEGTEISILKSIGHTTYPSLPIVTSEQATPIDHQPFMEQWMWITLGVLAFILIVLLVVCAVLRRRHRTSRAGGRIFNNSSVGMLYAQQVTLFVLSDAEDPVYANTRSVVSKQPSPRPGGPADNLKAVSSSENLRNPSPGQRYGEGNRRHRP
ncbi:hypothetical protein L3Q82_025895 [Scortum barcoo]|uniref:Uncharacterized protein n=1 Tax=Scortum barcoo TaxID=214431 RepID=A0ACB8WM87_9TELE|nr:hypothetical protein L3Q82_025895 [Scortum barcoo]